MIKDGDLIYHSLLGLGQVENDKFYFSSGRIKNATLNVRLATDNDIVEYLIASLYKECKLNNRRIDYAWYGNEEYVILSDGIESISLTLNEFFSIIETAGGYEWEIKDRN
jgi:hypothetical protein